MLPRPAGAGAGAAAPGGRSLLAVPIFSRHDAIGVLEVADKRSGAFDESDACTLTIIASQAGVAIHNARLLQDLQEANRELGRLDKLKSDFIAVASHELRTPLGVILGYAAILRERPAGRAPSTPRRCSVRRCGCER